MCVLLAVQVMASSPDANPPSLAYRPHDPLNLTAFNHFYNLDYDRAVQEFEQVLGRHPDDPFAVNHLLTATLFRELYRMGAMNTGEYANDSFISAGAPSRRSEGQSSRSRIWCSRRRSGGKTPSRHNPNDVDALYARGVTRAQFSLYTALIERAWFSALRNAVGARRDHERVLELSQSTGRQVGGGSAQLRDGKPALGGQGCRSLVGLGGNKEKGIQYLNESARPMAKPASTLEFCWWCFCAANIAMMSLCRSLRAMVSRFPRNYLFPLEEGQPAARVGQQPEASGSLSKGVASGQRREFSTAAL